MTKTQAKKQIAAIKAELQWLVYKEKRYNENYMFQSQRYSKRRNRLVKMYWILKGAL